MSRLVARARRNYELGLRPGEEVRDVVTGYASGIGVRVASGMVAGALVGWLYALYLEAAALPALVLGACGGIIAGYYLAVRQARLPEGPGAAELLVVLTDRRLLTTRRHSALRRKALRSHELVDVAATTAHRYPIGQYHRQQITMTDGTTTDFIVSRKLPIEPVNGDPTSG